MGLHHPARRLIQNQIRKVELHHMVQSRRKVVKKLVELSVRSDRLGNFEESLVLAVQKIHFLLLDRIVLHGPQSIRRSMTIQEVIRPSIDF